ncbi:Glycosyl transferases group 1 [Pedobacter terrae]|uniref:Glycosyl transferases group 1 n=1 Tax=Pedobacter terrae TaxID=405671 RepID=A0A1G7U5H5_9SPHI|nr:glycosyltransferase family 1 protein [Pedobacter terrae]SDG42010.1 Glycosyl transferases group 1 [Pedobacter terrae]
MYKLTVGIPIADYDLHGGGSFSYPTQLIDAIDSYEFNAQIEIVFIDFKNKEENPFKKKFLSFHPFKKPKFRDFSRKLLLEMLKKLKIFNALLLKTEEKHSFIRNKNVKKKLEENNIHILFNITPGGNDYDFPFITIHWDIGHRSTFMFPEFINSFDSRELFYEKSLKKALYILTETECGKKELMRYTNLNEYKIGVMPMFPSSVIDVIVDIEIQEQFLSKISVSRQKFFLYPAQFWAHKNHILLIDAFSKIPFEEHGIKLVLTGSDKGNLPYIKKHIKALNLQDAVIFLGFVTNEELYTLYKHAAALVMPTYLGPSNMPPLEAANLGCPVIISDLEGHREIMGDYAEYFKADDVEALTHKMIMAIEEPKAREYHLQTFNIDNAMRCLEKTLLKIIPIRKTWGN